MSDTSIPSPLSAFSAAVAELVRARGAERRLGEVGARAIERFRLAPGPRRRGGERARRRRGDRDRRPRRRLDPGRACRPRSVDRRRASARPAHGPAASACVRRRRGGRRARARRRRAGGRSRRVARDRLLRRPAMAQHARRAHRRQDRTQRGLATIERGRARARRRRPRLRHGGLRPETAHPGHSLSDDRPRRGDARVEGQDRARLSGSRPAAGEARRRAASD